MSVEINTLPKLNDAKQNEERDDEETKEIVEEEERTLAPSISMTHLGEPSTVSLGLMNDRVKESKDEVEVPVLLSSASDLVEDPLLLPSTNDKLEDTLSLSSASDLVEDAQLLPSRINHNEVLLSLPPTNYDSEDTLSVLSESDLVEDPLLLPSVSEDHQTLPLLKDNLEDPLPSSSSLDQVKDSKPLSSGCKQLEESTSLQLKDKGEYPLSLPSASSSGEDSLWLPLASDLVKESLSQPPLTELVEDSLLLSPSKDKVDHPLSLPSVSDHVKDTQPLSSRSEHLEDPFTLPPAYDKVADSLSPLSKSDLAEDPLPSTINHHEVPSASACSKDPLSPNNEEPLLILSGDEYSEEPLQTKNDHSYTSPMEIDCSIWSNLTPTKSKSEDIKPCSPSQTNQMRKTDGVDSDSDSDVIYVERNPEVIELSDDEAGECADLLTSLNIPEEVINCLKAASNKVSLKLGDLIKNSGSVNNIVVEVPTVTWSIPWVCVSSLFKNPEFNSKSKKSPAKSKICKSKRKWTEDIPKKKMSKVSESSVGAKEMKNTLCNIKKEKELYQDTDRILSVIHFDKNKPPEFCEISRSGRLIKKPTRLKDDMTFFRRTRRGRKKQEEAIEEVDNAIKTPDELRNEPSTSEDKNSETSEKSFENSMDSESCDRWMLGLNTDSENEEINVDDVSDLPPIFPIPTETIEILSDDGLDQSSTNGKLSKNYKEQKRRETLKYYFCTLLREVKSARKDFMDVKAPKVNILNEAINTIKQLESNINDDKILHQDMSKRNEFLFRELTKLKKTLPK